MLTKRKSFKEIYIQLAYLMSSRSSCSRLKVGCVITSDDFRYVYAVGYNGSGSGLPNKCDHSDRQGQCGCLHAEINACINCTKDRHLSKVVFLTHSPCIQCSKALINLGGIKKIWYSEKYRDKKGLSLLKAQFKNKVFRMKS